MKLNRIIIGSYLVLSTLNLYAQAKFPGGIPGYSTPNPNAFVDVPTPTAASLGKYGDIGVSYFTGNPNISIPLYNLTVRGVTMPISLDYDASGVMVNSLPTWAGQNWTLNIGGVITRTVKGYYDEWVPPRQTSSSGASNYFKCHNKLKELLIEGKNYQKLKQELVYGQYDLSPDEYTFHFLGKSGKFYLDDTGSWRVQSNDNLEVIFDYNKNSNFISPLFSRYPNTMATEGAQRKTIAGFVLRDDNGNSYQFGYNRNAIEYTTNFWHMSRNEENESWHAMSWYLTKITDKYGNVLFTLDYERGAYVIQVFNSYYYDEVKEKVSGFLGASTDYSVTNNHFPYTFSIGAPVYLKQIKTMSGLLVNIFSSNVPNNLATENIYKSIYDEYSSNSSFYCKLASMVPAWGPSGNGSDGYSLGAFYYVNGSGNEAKDANDSIVKFRYTPSKEDKFDVLSYARIRKLNYITIHSPKAKKKDYIGYKFCMKCVNSRLRLDSLMIQDEAIHYSSTTGIKSVYRFRYHEFEKLPGDYLTTAVDHWGYYNGNPYFNRNQRRPKNNLEVVRNPNFAFTQIGTLNEIQYPTGGISKFEYEPNTYNKHLTHDRQSMVNSYGIGGGLRIKSIKNYESTTHAKLLKERDFIYNIPGTAQSSGELFATPIYNWKEWKIKCELKNATYHLSTCHTTSIVPLANSFGPSLGYSFVTEIIKDLENPNAIAEKHVYKYSNLSDPAVRDQKFYLTFGYTDAVTPYDAFSELGFKRGNLLNEDTYDGKGRKVHSVGYKYRTDDYLSNHYVLTSNLLYKCNGYSAQYYHYLGGVYKLYYPKYDVVEKQDTIFNHDGSSPLITISTYDKIDKRFTSWHPYKHRVDVRLTTSEKVKRGNFGEENIYHFGQFENGNTHDSLLYKSMSYIKPLSTTYLRNGQKVSNTKTVYKTMTLNKKLCLLPSMITTTNFYNNIDTLVNYFSYTSTGMPFSYKELGKPTTYLRWAVNDCYLMTIGDYYPYNVSDTDFYDTENYQAKISQFQRGSACKFVGYVYNPLFGPVAVILPNGNMTSYKYDRFGRLTEVHDCDNKLLRDYRYNIRK